MLNEPQPTTLMIVDDMPANLTLLGDMLRDRGYRVLAFPNGPRALAAAVKSAPALILLDIKMPDMDGFEVCRRLKADPELAPVPVIFLSAFDDAESKLKAFELGGVDYVAKPFQTAEVAARVATHLQLAALRRALESRNDDLERAVAARTRELTEANQRLLALDRLKGDFLRMISHEIRTPANGLLGMGELIIQTYLPAHDPEARADALSFRQSGERLNDLINDATLIAEMQQLKEPLTTRMTCAELFCDLRQNLPHVEIQIESEAGADFERAAPNCQDAGALHLQHNPMLLYKAVSTTLNLAEYFVLDVGRLPMRARLGEQLSLRIELDALNLTAIDASNFFELASPVRALSHAQALGLAPVVAHDILSAFGGDLRLVKTGERTGYLEIVLRAEPASARAAAPISPTPDKPCPGTPPL